MARTSTLLSPDQVESVHEGSLEILENVGVLERNPEARERFAAYGGRVDGEMGIVRIPRAIVEEHRQLFPPTLTFHGLDPHFDRTIPGRMPR